MQFDLVQFSLATSIFRSQEVKYPSPLFPLEIEETRKFDSFF